MRFELKNEPSKQMKEKFVTIYTVESLNKGNFAEGSLLVLCKEIVLFERFVMYWKYDLKLCPLWREYLYFGVSTIGDSTVF